MKGLTMMQCKNEEEALNCLFEGEQNRTVGGNAININSSRSHAIFSISFFYLEVAEICFVHFERKVKSYKAK